MLLTGGLLDSLDGPVQVRLTVSGGMVERVETFVGAPRSREARDLGTVAASDAASYLLDLAARGANGSASAKALMPAVLAERLQSMLDTPGG